MARVIVGVDGSRSSTAAIDWALDYASSGDEVVLVSAWSVQVIGALEVPSVAIADFHADTTAMLEKSREEATEKAADGVRIETELHQGHPGQVLIDASESADLLVVGSRGYGGFKGLLLGSVSTYVVHHAQSPVVIVPADTASH